MLLSIVSLLLIASATANVVPFEAQSPADNYQLCLLCNQLSGLVFDNATLGYVLKHSAEFCEHLPTEYQTACRFLIQGQAEYFINKIRSTYDDKKFCTDVVQVCHSDKVAKFADFTPKLLATDTAKCITCRLGVDMLNAWLKNDGVKSELYKLITLPCGSGSVQSEMCKQFLSIIQLLVQWLGNIMNASFVCQTMSKACVESP